MFAVSIDQRTPQLIIIITTTITTIPKLTFLGEDFVDYDGADPMAVREDSDLATDDANAELVGRALEPQRQHGTFPSLHGSALVLCKGHTKVHG